MNSVIVTLILIVLTISLGVSLLDYYTSLSSNTYNSVLPLQIAMELSKELQVSYSPPSISYAVPAEKGQPLNISVDILLTLNLNFSGPIYLILFLMKSSYSPYYYIPTPLFSNGFINEISNPNDVGYVDISGQGVKTVELTNARINLLTGSITNINAYAFEVTPGEELNVTFTTNESYVPVMWVVVDLYGNLYRIAYPVISSQIFVNTYCGSGSSVTTTTYGQLFEKLFGDYSLLFETGPNSELSLGENSLINTPSNVGYNSNGNSEIKLDENAKIYANHLYLSPSANIAQVGKNAVLPLYSYSNDIPYVPLQYLINPLYSEYNPYQFQLQLEKEANQIYNNYKNNFVVNPNQASSFNYPVIFTGSVTFNNQSVTFNYPVIFEGPVTVNGGNLTFKNLVIFENSLSTNNAFLNFDNIAVFEGSVQLSNSEISFNSGALFNSSSSAKIIISRTNILANGPIIMNLTASNSEISFSGQTAISDSSPIISLTAGSITTEEDSNIQISNNYPLFIQTNSPQNAAVSFGENSSITINGGAIINADGGKVKFSEGSQLNIPNGDLIINTGEVITPAETSFGERSSIHVNGQIVIDSYKIKFSENTQISSTGYAILYGQDIKFDENSQIIIKSGIAENSENSQIVKIITPIGLNPSSLYITGWFSIIPNNSITPIDSTTLLNTTYQVYLNLVTTPKTPTEYNLILYVNSTLYDLTTINAFQPYMYVIEGYISQGYTYLERLSRTQIIE
ncbi:hypothetical protein [Saccharolobus shibatae]|uniref:Uncharacterized protein n=1 Tax=Saccharolobus shibatae TaxID=2286 RepID=A0A8F5GYS9_9CREN|nr:hypothetical protein [Saccharolobus shibatae]QXJ33827.1 hypothetical protein J5U22_00372 [Saccharolobus shibatae]